MGGRIVSAGFSNPAGAITVRLVTCAGRVDAASVSSSRHLDVAQRLFRGRPVEHALATLPMIFSVCATAQACAATAACENASEIQPDPRHLQARELLLLAGGIDYEGRLFSRQRGKRLRRQAAARNGLTLEFGAVQVH